MRLAVTQRADLAVRSLVILHHSPTRLKSEALADALGTTAGFVPQVMAPMVREGWVRSVPGPSGGYELRTDIDNLSVLAVVESVDGPTDSGQCVVADRACDSTTPCALHDAWGRARQELESSLDAIFVSSLALKP